MFGPKKRSGSDDQILAARVIEVPGFLQRGQGVADDLLGALFALGIYLSRDIVLADAFWVFLDEFEHIIPDARASLATRRAAGRGL